MKLHKTLVIALLLNLSAYSQATWQKSLNGAAGGPTNIGTNYNSSFNIYTNNRYIAKFSSGNGLYGLNGTGDGLRIHNMFTPGGGLGEIDIYTTSSNGTEIRFGGSGNIAGRSNRFEMWGHYNGLYFNASGTGGLPYIKFATAGTINAFVGTNRYWRIGDQSDATNLAAQTRLQVVDLTTQLRLTNAGANVNSGNFTDFFTNAVGNLQVVPSAGRVGINLMSNPTTTLDVNGNVRIREVLAANPNSIIIGVNVDPNNDSDVHVRRLDFTGDPNDVLLGDGTWGTASSGSVNDAHNGLSVSTFDPAKIAFGQNAFQALDPARLFSNREIPLNDNYVHFSDMEVADVGYMGLGSTFAPDSRTKFSIFNDTLVNSQTIRTFSHSGSFVNARNSLVATTYHANTLTGVFGQTIGAKTISYGIRGRSVSSESLVQSLGGNFEGLGDNERENNGVRGYAKNSSKLNIGGKFAAENDNPNESSWNIGVYGEATGTPSAAGYFIGNVVTTGSSFWLSDSTYKDSIVTIGDNLDSLFNGLHPVSFKYNEEAQINLNAGSEVKLGFLAQEIAAVYPWLAKEIILPAKYDSTGLEIRAESTYIAVDVTQLIPLLVSVEQKSQLRIDALTAENTQQQTEIEELQDLVTDLNSRLSNLENCLSGILPMLCQLSQNAIEANTPETQELVRQNLNVTLSSRNAIILDQNVPNPFAEQTIINFSIPPSVVKAQIHFYDGNGRIIQSVDVNERGLGSITVFGADLSSGTYTYTLVADGQIVATKKMVKQ